MTAPSTTAHDLWLDLTRAHAAWSALASGVASRHRLSVSELSLLQTLQSSGPMLLGALQQQIHVSSGGATFLVDRLERRGLVRRRTCADDRRATYALLTPKGERLAARIRPMHRAVLRRASAGLTAAERRTVDGLLRTLAAAANPQRETSQGSSRNQRSASLPRTSRSNTARPERSR
jgi:MarR family 2-MHQ and catechol resistance regulon transcriptional repressor